MILALLHDAHLPPSILVEPVCSRLLLKRRSFPIGDHHEALLTERTHLEHNHPSPNGLMPQIPLSHQRRHLQRKAIAHPPIVTENECLLVSPDEQMMRRLSHLGHRQQARRGSEALQRL